LLSLKAVLDQDDEEHIRPSTTNLCLASADHLIQSEGKVTLEFEIKKIPFVEEFYVVSNLRHSIILGSSFFRKHQAHLDYKRDCISLGLVSRTTVYWNTTVEKAMEEVWMPLLDETVDHDIVDTLYEFQELFQKGVHQPTTISTQHQIILKSNKIIHRQTYPMSPDKKRILNEQLEEMLRAGVIEASTSPYASPPVLVMRPGKKPRFCIDFRELNNITEDTAKALPRITDALKSLSDATIFSVMDLRSGYWQIPMAPEDREKTAFVTPDGSAYHFRVMPFGLKNAPGTFQHLMVGEVLTGLLLHECALVYLDDIIVYSKMPTEHVRHLRVPYSADKT